MLPMVEAEVTRVLRRVPPSVLRDDLVSAGRIGLLDALRRNKRPRDVAFAHYVRIRVRGAILDELRREDWLTRSERERERAAVVATDVVHMEDLPTGFDDAPSQDECPVDALANRSRWKAVAAAVRLLPPRERAVIELLHLHGWRVKDVAHRMGVSLPRVSQLHAQALGRLRAWLAIRAPHPHVQRS